MSQAIFLSYASQDADAARGICDAMRAIGLEVWFDQNELRGGDAWEASIRNQIKACTLFVPLISATSNARSEGFFRLEWKLAVDRSHLMADDQKFLFPALIDDTAEPTARVPDRFRERQWSRLTSEQSITEFANRIARIVTADGGDLIPVMTEAVVKPEPVHGDSRASIAVMPLLNMSSEADNEYFCDGLAEELLSALSRVKGLHVAARSSSFSFKGKQVHARDAGRLMNVNGVLEGSVKKSGKRLRISVQLVNVASGFQLWSERYDAEMDDVFDVQDQIALAVVTALKVTLLGDDSAPVLKRATNNAEAYERYLRGRFHYVKRTKNDLLHSIAHFEEAIAFDPGFALAYAAVAEAYLVMPAYPYLAPSESIPKARSAARRALEIDPDLPEGRAALAFCLAKYDWDWLEAERQFKLARELAPGNADARFRYAVYYLLPMGRFEEAITELRAALQLEPLSLNMGLNLVWLYHAAREDDLALEQARKLFDMEPNLPLVSSTLSLAYIGKAMYGPAIELIEKALQREPENQPMLRNAGVAYARSGDRKAALNIVGRFKALADSQYVNAYWIANIHAALGELDQAFAELQKAYVGRDWDMNRLKVDPFMDSLHGDPRYEKLIQQMGLPP